MFNFRDGKSENKSDDFPGFNYLCSKYANILNDGMFEPKLGQIFSPPESPRRNRTENQLKAVVAEEKKALGFGVEFVFDEFLPMLMEGGELEEFFAFPMVQYAREEFSKESLLVDLNFEAGVETIIVGDIHGQFDDLLLIFEKFGRPGKDKRFIFNGDIVDRGPRSVACWLLICSLKVSCPEYVFVTRGNHETRTVSLLHSSFASECANNYTQSFFLLCQKTFDELPLAYVLNKTIFVTHGGLPKDLCLKKMRQMPKDPLHPNFDQKIFMGLLWNDPRPILGYGANNRGPSVHTFGPDITENFLQKHGLSLLIRSHEYQVFGHQYTHQSRCLTIFSCPDYQKLGNSGAVAIVDSNGKVKVEQFY